MNRLRSFIDWLPSPRKELDRFDFVDRMVVWLFMMISMITLILYLSEHATESEVAGLIDPLILGASFFDLLAYLVFFFLVWPLLRYVLSIVAIAVWEKYRGRGGEKA